VLVVGCGFFFIWVRIRLCWCRWLLAGVRVCSCGCLCVCVCGVVVGGVWGGPVVCARVCEISGVSGMWM
jgi:hypothetical protein